MLEDPKSTHAASEGHTTQLVEEFMKNIDKVTGTMQGLFSYVLSTVLKQIFNISAFLFLQLVSEWQNVKFTTNPLTVHKVCP